MAEDYEREKLANAVSSLVSARPIQERLVYAFTSMHTLKAHGFTNEDRQAEYEGIYSRLTAKGNVEETCSALTDEEAEEIANDIVSLNTQLNWNRVYELQDEIDRLKRG